MCIIAHNIIHPCKVFMPYAPISTVFFHSQQYTTTVTAQFPYIFHSISYFTQLNSTGISLIFLAIVSAEYGIPSFHTATHSPTLLLISSSTISLLASLPSNTTPFLLDL